MSAKFDIIFAGGGTTACVVAGRLIAAEPSLKILIVERGLHSYDLPNHVQPCRFIDNIAPTSTTVYCHTDKSGGQLDGRSLVLTSGKCVGGSSAINFMVYVRGAASDYDDWAKLGNEGWSFTELLPLVKKAETFTPIPDQATHGYSGPIQISAYHADIDIGQQFLDVARDYDPHRPQVEDCNDFKTSNAYSGPWPKYVNPKTGRRSDAASAYLYPQSHNPNLQIWVGKCVKRVIIKDGRAVGVEYIDVISAEASSEIVTAMASKLVVVSGGTFGSPTILERSGIGNPIILNNQNVPVMVDLPGVGENYQDHFGAFPVFHAADDTNTLDDVWSDPGEISARLAEWQNSGKGKIACNGGDAFMKFRPTKLELEAIGPAFQSKWEGFFHHSPDKPVALVTPFAGYLLYNTALPPSGRKFFTMIYFLLYPDSVGNVHISSWGDPKAPVALDTRIFSNAGDIACLTMLYKKTREIARRMPAYRGETSFLQPQFAADSPAACRETDGPVPIDAPDIMYSAEDDRAIEDFHRKAVQAIWHALGTCPMKPREQGGVVDARLNVYGVQGLKVADLSICPLNVGNNTYSTALLVGEKAATIIAQDLGITLG